MLNNFFVRKSCRLWDNVAQYCRAGQATDDNIIRLMPIARWIIKATNTHSEYVILIAYPLQQWWHERASILRYTYNACLFAFRKTIWRKYCQLLSLPYLVNSGEKVSRTNSNCKRLEDVRECVTILQPCNIRTYIFRNNSGKKNGIKCKTSYFPLPHYIICCTYVYMYHLYSSIRVTSTHVPNFNCCFTVHFDKYKIILPTSALFIKT